MCLKAYAARWVGLCVGLTKGEDGECQTIWGTRKESQEKSRGGKGWKVYRNCNPLFAFSLNPEMQRIHNQRSVQCTGDRDGRQETPMGATAPSERPL